MQPVTLAIDVDSGLIRMHEVRLGELGLRPLFEARLHADYTGRQIRYELRQALSCEPLSQGVWSGA